jgi:hypothetical protein
MVTEPSRSEDAIAQLRYFPADTSPAISAAASPCSAGKAWEWTFSVPAAFAQAVR